MALDPTLALALVGLLVAGFTLAYSRSQARQAERATLLGSNLAMFERFARMRSRLRDHPPVLAEFLAAHPEVERVQREVGGPDVYVMMRDVMDTLQDVYFMRRAGVVTDQYWHMWSHSLLALYGGMPTFRKVFEFAAKNGYLHPQFVAFYRPVFEGRQVADPRR
ncbi:MAG: hypothetical protein ACYDCK_03795 [Thermoplasmatota archaeon]